MEKLKSFLFLHGEKVGLAAVFVLCLLGLLLAQPWNTGIEEVEALRTATQQLERAFMAGSVPTLQAPDFVARLQEELVTPGEVEAFPPGKIVVVDTQGLIEQGTGHPAVAAAEDVTVTPKRGRLLVSWKINPESQAAENERARWTGVLQLVRADIYRALAASPDQLELVGSTDLSDVVVVPARSLPTAGFGLAGPSVAGSRRSGVGGPEVPPGMMSAEEAQQRERFVFADSDVEAGQDYVYKVRLVARNPLYTAQSDMPEFIESDLGSTNFSVAQRPQPSIQWFFLGGAPDFASVTVYKWHVVTVSPEELTTTPAEQGVEEAASVEGPVEQAGWVAMPFVVRPGDPIGGVATKWIPIEGTDKQKQARIDFSTGATAVALAPEPRILPGAGTAVGTAGAPVGASLLLSYLDADGNLQSRWQEPDLLKAELAPRLPGQEGGREAATRPGSRASEGVTGRGMSREQYEQRMQKYAEQERREAERIRQQIQQQKKEDERLREQREREQQYVPSDLPF